MFFEYFKQTFFMIDLFPENSQRFPMSLLEAVELYRAIKAKAHSATKITV